MSENENKEIEQELSMLDEQKIAEEAEKVIAEKTEEPEIEVEVFVEETNDAEETAPEIEVEVFVEEPELSEEDAAFIAEEAAKIEQAEDAGNEEKDEE